MQDPRPQYVVVQPLSVILYVVVDSNTDIFGCFGLTTMFFCGILWYEFSINR